MASACILTQRQRQDLVYGFINQITYASPDDLIDLCTAFYDDVFEWRVPHKQFKSLLQKHKVDDISRVTSSQLTSPQYKINDIIFECKLSKGYYSGQIEFDLYIKSMPKHIERITYFMQMFCTQILYEFRSFDSMERVGKSKGWPKRTVNAQSLKQFSSLNLGCYLDVLAMEYKAPQLANYYKPIHMDICSEFRWEIDGDLMRRFKASENGRGFYAESFNHGCLCIIASPNGTIKANEGTFVLGLKLLRIHHHLKGMTLRVKTSTDLMDFGRKASQQKKVDVHANLVKLWPNVCIQFGIDAIKNVDRMEICIKVQIMALKSSNYYEDDIDIDCWSSYGIV